MNKRLKPMTSITYNELASNKIGTPGDGSHLFGSSGIRGVVNEDLSIDFCRIIAESASQEETKVLLSRGGASRRKHLRGRMIV